MKTKKVKTNRPAVCSGADTLDAPLGLRVGGGELLVVVDEKSIIWELAGPNKGPFVVEAAVLVLDTVRRFPSTQVPAEQA